MRNWMKWSVVLVIVALVGTGCSKRLKVNLDGLDQNPAGAVNENGMTNAIGNENGNGNYDGSFVPSGATLVNYDDVNGAGSNGAAASGWGALDKPVMVAGGNDVANFVRNGQYFEDVVYFDFNRSEVRPSERPKLEKLANQLLANPTMHVVIEGHCDERGSDEYNRALSERRSLAVLDYLVSLGVNQSTMRTVSYGEDQPAVKDARTEAEHQQNRRAQFLVGTP